MEPKQNRVGLIDGLRGFSLFGILMANMLIFQYGIWGKEEIAAYAMSSLDTGVIKLVKLFVESSFMPIFTFMFGFSLIKLKESLEAKGLKQKRDSGGSGRSEGWQVGVWHLPCMWTNFSITGKTKHRPDKPVSV